MSSHLSSTDQRVRRTLLLGLRLLIEAHRQSRIRQPYIQPSTVDETQQPLAGSVVGQQSSSPPPNPQRITFALPVPIRIARTSVACPRRLPCLRCPLIQRPLPVAIDDRLPAAEFHLTQRLRPRQD